MRVVVKVGTSTLAHKTGCLNIRLVETLCKTLADLQNAGHQIVLVSSGAIGMGVGKLQLGARPSDMATKQAAAAVGQCELMYTYDKLFTEYNHTVAQVLLTAADIEDKMRRHNVETTLQRLLQLGAIPVINENDTVSTAEIAEVSTLGDNDTLASIVAVSVEADLLVLLSDIEGLYTDARFAKSLGFSGKASISPRHVEGINEVFSPTQAEIDYAHEVMETIRITKQQGKGVVSLHGKMIDAPIVERARQVIEMEKAMFGGVEDDE